MKKTKKQMKKNLILIVILSILVVSTAILGFITITKQELLSVISFIISIVFLFFMLKVNSNFEYYRHEYNYINLLHNKDKSILKNNNLLNSKHHEFLLKLENYSTKAIGDNNTLYYKIDDGLNNKRRNKTLYSLLIYKDDIDFTDIKLARIFENLESSLAKGESFHNRIFFQIKITNQKISDNDIKDTDKIFFVKHRRNSVVVLNITYNPITKDLYYLRGKNFTPVFFLDFAIKKLENILSFK